MTGRPTLHAADDSAPRVDIGALAGSIKIDVLEAASQAVVFAIEWADREPGGISEKAKFRVVEAHLECFQNIETTIRGVLEQAIPAELHWQPH